MIAHSVAERLESNIERIPFAECWFWTGSTTKGYGTLRVDGKLRYAHRVSYAQYVGPIPAKNEVCHRCDVPLCVNPNHLFAGTHKENMTDFARKGRAKPCVRFGEQHHGSVLTNATAAQARELRKTGMSYRAIGELVGASGPTVRECCIGLRWNDEQSRVKP